MKQEDLINELTEKIRKFRPPLSLMLKLSVVFALVYYAVYTLLFFVSLLFQDFITEFSLHYYPDQRFGVFETLLLLIAGFLGNGLVVTGLIFMLAKRKIGPFLYGFSAFLIVFYQFATRDFVVSDKIVVESILFVLIVVLRIWFSKAVQASETTPHN